MLWQYFAIKYIMRKSEIKNRSSILNKVAGALNSCARTVVFSYDAWASGMGKVYDVAKKTPGATKRIFGLLQEDEVKSKETAQLLKKIKISELKLNKLCSELGRKSMEAAGSDNPSDPEEVQSLLAEVKDFKSKVELLKERLVALEGRERANLLLKKELKAYARYSAKTAKRYGKGEPEIRKAVRQAIADALEHDDFASGSDRVTFQTVAYDLLDRRMEIKILAAAELGKMRCAATVDVLKEALKFDNPRLTLEIIDSLTTIGDRRALPIETPILNENVGVRIKP